MITAVDIGATKTLIAQFNHKLQPIHELRFETSKDQNIFLKELEQGLTQFPEVDTISIGAPGIIDDNGVILRCANLPWTNFPLKKILVSKYSCPVFIDNDANLAGLAEINALQPVPRLGIYITISTGIGGGIIVNGRLLDGLKQIEPGHMIFNFKGEWQEWEDFAAGSAIVNQYKKLAKDITLQSDWQQIAEQICIGLNAIVPTLQPDVIVFGGSVGRYFEKYGHFLAEKLDHRLPKYLTRPKLSEAKHPNEAVLYGCHYLAKHQIHG